jgi:hypothetical protein
MSRIQSVRLAQFWEMRLEPLLREFRLQRVASSDEAFEAVGWLIEGVFSGFFDQREADVLWIRIAPLLEACVMPDNVVASESLAAEVSKLQQSSEPFRQSAQMMDGLQKQFELPLFTHALLVANRLATDSLARICSAAVRSPDLWEHLKASWHSVRPSEVEAAMILENEPQVNVASLVGGYVRILEHMEVSRSFFGYAKFHAPRGSDFESYCQRIGALNAWRVPLNDPGARGRFDELSDLLEFTVRPTIESMPNMQWSDFEISFSAHLSALIDAWEAHHLSAALSMA